MVARAIAGALVLALAVSPAFAQGQKPAPAQKKEQPAAPKKDKDKPKEAEASADPVVARVNGAPVYRSDLEALRRTLPAQVQQEKPEELYPKLLQQVIALQLVTQSARKEKLNDNPVVKRMVALAEEQILQDAYFDSVMRTEITEAKLKQRYDESIKAEPPHEEVHARHIVVATEDEAKQIIEQLKKGADFATLAAAKTTDPSGKSSGGDLGYFSQADMVPEFSKMAFSLKPGEISPVPVHTQFGWHVIQVEDKRQSKPPTYEEVAPKLAREMAQELYAEKVKELAKEAKIEVFNPDGSKPTAAAPSSAPAAPSAAAPSAAPPTASASPPPEASGQPQLMQMQNGNPGEPPSAEGPPAMAPATQGLGK
jgi:peptidyl-prolyl cis-trans isomerase C